MRPRKWTLNETYFDSIDTPEKAYWLGLLYADSYNNVRGHQITLALKAVDQDTVAAFMRAVATDAPVVIRMGGGFAGKSPVAVATLNSVHMCATLARHGCGQRKSDVIRYPFWLDRALWSHFVRGYFDGDGGLSREMGTRLAPRHVKYRANIVSNPHFVDDLNQVFEQELGRQFYVLRYHGHKRTTQIRIEGNRQVESFLSWLYQDATVKMKRKHDLFEALLAHERIEQAREVYAYRVADGSLVGHYESRAEAARQLDLWSDSVVRCCQDPKRTTGGYRFTNRPLDTHHSFTMGAGELDP